MKQRVLFFILVLNIFTYTNAQITEFWGVTSEGGKYNCGTIFKTDSNGNNLTIVMPFSYNRGALPQYTSLCKYSNGKLYGLTAGNQYTVPQQDVLFEYDPTTDKYEVKQIFTGPNGDSPMGSLTNADNGKLYGLTYFGGTYNLGTLFEYDPANNQLNTLFSFDTLDGTNPIGDLILASNGKLYGTAIHGGTNGKGTLFEYDINTNTFTKLFDFDGNNSGEIPFGSLLETTNGKLYGTTYQGGNNNAGVIFEYNTQTNTFQKLYDFVDSIGNQPVGRLIEVSSGIFYGMTSIGGTNGKGSIYKFNTSTNQATDVFDFTTNTGTNPMGSLLKASDGLLYGLLAHGGINGKGTLFSYDYTNSTFNKLIDLADQTGSTPFGSLIEYSNGIFYGLTNKGGLLNGGVLFKYDAATGNYSKKIGFGESPLGSSPDGSLLLATNNKLYGLASYGGKYNNGTLFEYDPTTQTYSKKADFENSTTGEDPEGSLIQVGNFLYGFTVYGGSNDEGVIFKYDLNNDTLIKIVDFDNVIKGKYPEGEMFLASNGKLYGLAGGGTNSKGILFEYDPNTNTFIKKYDFDNNSGTYPKGTLIENNGKLYGTCKGGGNNDQGTLFSFDINTNTYTKLYDFDSNLSGSNPYSYLTNAGNNILLGTTNTGGTNEDGILYKYDIINDTLEVLWNFDDTNFGKRPRGSLLKATNGKFYGLTFSGGTNDLGTLYEYDFQNLLFTKKIDFDSTNGATPVYTHLTEITYTPINSSEITHTSISMRLYPNPTHGIVFIQAQQIVKNYKLYDISGKCIQKAQVSDNKFQVNITDKAGYYFLEINYKNGQKEIAKIIKY